MGFMYSPYITHMCMCVHGGRVASRQSVARRGVTLTWLSASFSSRVSICAVTMRQRNVMCVWDGVGGLWVVGWYRSECCAGRFGMLAAGRTQHNFCRFSRSTLAALKCLCVCVGDFCVCVYVFIVCWFDWFAGEPHAMFV